MPAGSRSAVLTARTAALAAVLLVSGCTAFSSDPADGPADPGTVRAVPAVPAEALTVVADADPVSAALAASRALFESSDVVVVAPAADDAAGERGASVAEDLGVPLLVTSPSAGLDSGPLADELDRLGAGTVVAVRDGRSSSSASTSEGGRAQDLAVVPVPASGEMDDVELPDVDRADPDGAVLVLADGEPGNAPALATARAAGARVQLTGGVTDPRASADLVEALSEERPDAVVALGAAFADEDGLEWKLATAASGAQLPGGGQLLFPGHFVVALYGHPGTGALGVLGEQDLPGAIERARRHAAPYEALVDATVVPGFEIIATVASTAAGPDGNYSTETDIDKLRPWVEAAGEAGLYVVLDLQPGRTDFLTQARYYQPLLELPFVGLALDPEWRLGPNEVHLTQIGSVGVEEVNQVIGWLADLTREHALPQKLLVVHQFQQRMVSGRAGLDTSRDELAVMVHADGQGSQGAKQATWQNLHADLPPEPLYWGWKNFYDEDAPMLTPEQTIAQVSPTPNLISYQ